MISYFGYFTKSYKQNAWNLLLEIYEEKYYLIFSQDPEAALEAENKPNDEDWDDVIDDDEEDDDDDEGWITPGNFQQKRLEMFGIDASKKAEVVKVACMTTDFAMQVRVLLLILIELYFSSSLNLFLIYLLRKSKNGGTWVLSASMPSKWQLKASYVLVD